MAIQIFTSLVLVIFNLYGANSAVFTVKNNCGFDIWPAALTGQGSPVLTGFFLPPRASKTVTVPPPWSGRFWARTGCSTSGPFSCSTGDCHSGQIECNGAGGAPPVSLVEFTLAGSNNLDFFDISLVDGFNLPVGVTAAAGGCPETTCANDINRVCPSELVVRGRNGAVVGCKSACVAFNQPQYCCTGAYNTPETCKPTSYSQTFKSQCPQAYSYAFDDKSSTFTCPTGKDYVITFCP